MKFNRCKLKYFNGSFGILLRKYLIKFKKLRFDGWKYCLFNNNYYYKHLVVIHLTILTTEILSFQPKYIQFIYLKNLVFISKTK